MVIRQWSGRASPGNRGAYPAHFRQNVLPALRGLPGFRGAQLLEREAEGLVEFLVLTRWESMDAVRRFAGPEPDRAVVEPEAEAALVAFDREVLHYAVVDEAP
ncbi:antibiotic biosynthesis monooxygenase family protein [Paracraurococcus lichenis]|uniref:Antibiotic biosynthesis monooxygenase n=1 Tax=Paracraurococcus lichenis TaxID=3064888 RepID=A0ABT9DX48_9PROT|nr:antibiotic biosynthesis monooxygenase [Paracraurococcus sp. LOR1-02]MDO9708471.1 antibiotic biosynthesis monooxygenase [Paracraurococcus sp. LOR1-02]